MKVKGFSEGAYMDSAGRGASAQIEERKPVGLNEGDLESIVRDGFLGFCISAGCSMLLLFFSVYEGFAEGSGEPCFMVGVAFTGALLLAGRLFSDFLNSEKGSFGVFVLYVASFAMAMVFLVGDLFIPSTLSSGAAFVGTVFLYGKFLASLDRKTLSILSSVVLVFAGFTIIMVLPLEGWYALVPIGGAVLLSASMSALFYCRKTVYDGFGNAEESKDRSISVKGHNHALLLLGFMLGAVVLVPGAGVSGELAVLTVGGSMGVAGILSLLMGQLDERLYKGAMLKSCSLVAVVCLLALPALPSVAKLGALFVYFCHVWLNAIILSNAFIETARFNQINPVWLIGWQGAIYFSGLLVGAFVFSLGPILDLVAPWASYASLVLGAAVCSYMQISANYQAYPFEPVIKTSLEEQAISREITEYSGQRKSLYHKKREYACELYSLSPREREILATLLRGRDAKYIMDTFYISQSTAKTHIYNIYRKFDVHSRQELLDFIEGIELPPDDDADSSQDS